MPNSVMDGLPFSEEARTALGGDLYRYMLGRARDAADLQDLNEAEFRRYKLVPRVLLGNAATDISTTLCGRHLSAPIVAGAFAGDRVFHADGLLPIAAACRALSLPLVISEETVTPLAEICAEHDNCWLQLRAAGPKDRIKGLMDEAASAEAAGMVLTVLAPVHPVANLQPGGFSIGAEIARRGWKTIGSKSVGVEPLPAFPAWSWADLAEVVGHAKSLALPVMIKGVLNPLDVAEAAAAGCSGIIASNIGLRQSARWVPALRQLPALRSEATMTLGYDGGVRFGSDVVTAAALGADFSIVVRPLITALVTGGQQAVEAFLKGLIDETLAVASWCNAATLADLKPGLLLKDCEESL
ncbi:alpha-hydroxy acid oxidase [Rhizobium halophytocola]|uniref:4-hydroxymandelate oxidase n=1 Tax=Rhizobium halophytocola TaxID=735519 RepID=A0ABS4DUF2_9HYPH|nr:4-hydroxymandelate oxidase [Rhizobium halophytocola]